MTRDISFNRPLDSEPVFVVTVEHKLETWPFYMFIGLALFFLFVGLLVHLTPLILCGTILLVVFSILFKSVLAAYKNPVFELFEQGIWLRSLCFYIPWENVQPTFEKTQDGILFIGGGGITVTIKNLILPVRINSPQYSKIRLRLLFRASTCRDDQTGDMIVGINLPFTVGKGRMLNISKEDLAQKLNEFIARNSSAVY